VDANAIPGEAAASYKIPATVPVGATLDIAGAKASDTAVYNRALSNDEITLLIAEQQKKDVLAKRLKEEFGAKADLAKGKLAAAAEAKEFTFATWLELDKDKKEPSGKIFQIGQGDNALTLSLDKGRLTIQAGKAKMTQVSPLATGKKVHVTGTFDGKTLKLYTDGNLYKRYNWRTIWTYPAIITAALLVLMILFFHVPKKEEAAEAPADEAPAEEPPAEDQEQKPE